MMKIPKKYRISNTPEPPYYSAITTATLNKDLSGYYELAEQLIKIAKDTEGFLGLETCIDEDCGIAVSYWQSEQAIENWSRNFHHSQAKKIAKDRWFTRYITRIAKVGRVY